MAASLPRVGENKLGVHYWGCSDQAEHCLTVINRFSVTRAVILMLNCAELKMDIPVFALPSIGSSCLQGLVWIYCQDHAGV